MTHFTHYSDVGTQWSIVSIALTGCQPVWCTGYCVGQGGSFKFTQWSV